MIDALPLALAIAASPFPVIPAILLLFTIHPRATSLSFLGGWLLGVGGAVTAFTLLADVIETHDQSPTWASWTRLILGIALTGFGIRQWVARHHVTKGPAWMQSIESATPRRAFTLALLLSVANPKILLLAAAAGLGIGAATATTSAQALTIIAFTIVASLTVAIPVLGYALLGDRVLRPLTALKGWLERNNAALMAVVITVIGIALAVKGATSL